MYQIPIQEIHSAKVELLIIPPTEKDREMFSTKQYDELRLQSKWSLWGEKITKKLLSEAKNLLITLEHKSAN